MGITNQAHQAKQGGFSKFLFACLTLAPLLVGAVTIDQKAIHSAYNEGDFDAVIRLTNQFTSGKASYIRSDSLFVFKHLAVVYSANPETREKGKYFMYRMLEMFPSAELVEMYVSDDVDRIFDKVRKEFMTRQKNFGVDTTQISLPQKAGSASASPMSETAGAKPKKGGMNPIWYWVAGGAVAVGAGVTAVLLMQSDEGEGKTYVISAN